jgi:methyl-accepting chemotaxis protein
MDLRRITTAIRADCGNVDRQNGHATSSEDLVTEIYSALDTFVRLVNADPDLTQEEKSALSSEADNKRQLTALYKRDLIDPNIAHAIADDMENLSANSTAQAGLIAQFNSATNEMVEFEKEQAQKLIEKTNDRSATYRMLLIIIGILIVLASLALALIIANMIDRPIDKFSNFLKRAATTGDTSFTPDEMRNFTIYKQNKDEIGQMITNCSAFVDHVYDSARNLQNISAGDLTVSVRPLSQSDILGISMQTMVENLNSMFGDINNASSQVTSGAVQISDGAQALASGSTEQAATVEQLSASIEDISEKTRGNAQRTEHAAQLAATIMKNAEKGNNQMAQMISAVNEINQANQNISKVIKAIDDIAFQTNILALNAAVEAARAGAAGKGFAVVAEEVRNLAGKSALSAKETSALIANSTEKAELGTKIADETAASLAEIVAGIEESAKIIAEIAQSSEEQKVAISEINQGVSGVTQVVQQNSATAEESAAASEEMSGQASVLEDLIMRFKLK